MVRTTNKYIAHTNAVSEQNLLLLFCNVALLIVSTVLFLAGESNLELSTLLLVSAFLFSFLSLYSNLKGMQHPFLVNGNFWALLSLFMIFLLAPVVRTIKKTQLPYVFESQDWQSMYPGTNYLAIIAITSLMLGMISSKVRSAKLAFINDEIPHTNSQVVRLNVLVSVCIVIASVGVYIYWAMTQGSILTAVTGTRIDYRNASIFLNNGYFADSLFAGIGVVSVWLIVCKITKSRNEVLLFVILFLLILPSLLRGDRSKFIYMLLVSLIVLLTVVKKTKKLAGLVIVILLPALLIAPRLWREDNQFFSAIAQSYSASSILETLTREDTAMAPALSILINQVETEKISYQLGKSYLSLVTKPIPRSIWTEKPIPFDTAMNRSVFPITARQNVGFAFSAISEPFVNFGFMGVIIFFYILGYLNFHLFWKLRTGSIWIILVNSWVSGFMFVLIRGNLTTDIQRCLFPLLIAAALLKLSRLPPTRRFRTYHA